MHGFLTGTTECRTMQSHRRLSMFASEVCTGTARSLPGSAQSSLLALLTGGARFYSYGRRPLLSHKMRDETQATASRARAKTGSGMHLVHGCRTRRNTRFCAFSYALTSNRNEINDLQDLRTTHKIYYVKLLRIGRKIPPPGAPHPRGRSCTTPHTRSPKILPPGPPID